MTGRGMFANKVECMSSIPCRTVLPFQAVAASVFPDLSAPELIACLTTFVNDFFVIKRGIAFKAGISADRGTRCPIR
jgi:hypothetical protein